MAKNSDSDQATSSQLSIGRYSVVRELGRGGFGIVYLATDSRLGRPVAIKVLARDLATDTERLNRFEREARLLASLNHSGIATIYSLEETEDGSKFIVLEYVDGQTLEERLKRGPLPVSEALSVGLQVAEAVAAAHKRNVIHRDLKPANVMINQDGEAKVLDFGLARSHRDRAPVAEVSTLRTPANGSTAGIAAPGRPQVQGITDGETDAITDDTTLIVQPEFSPTQITRGTGADLETVAADIGGGQTQDATIAAADGETVATAQNMTRAGMIMGTPGYMSPEQIRGEDVDKSTDVFAFGCVLFECFAGRRAFFGKTPVDSMVSSLTIEPDLSLLPKETPPGIRDLLKSCLRKDRLQRLADIDIAREQIDVILQTERWGSIELKRVPAPAVHNLPSQLTSFVGRKEEVARVTELIGENRLLCLVGVGGCGKTRLALKAAESVQESFPDGVWFIELADVTSPDLIPAAIGTSLDVRQQAGTTLLKTIEKHLEAKTLLLVIDNCEHLLKPCGDIVATLLRTCPHLKILTTSREALGIGGETTWSVRSLTLPVIPEHEPEDATAIAAGPRLPVAEPGISIEKAMQSEAVSLFTDRAKAVRQDFELTDRNVLDVARICRRLDGIPLPIELAAARIKVLSPEQIHDKLSNRFRLLTGGSRSALERHQTLQATIDWSYELLSDSERALFRALSIFAGGRTIESATAVCGIDCDEYEVLDHLTHLVDKSLMVMEEVEGESRYRMLESIRQYAQVRLDEAGEVEATRNRHLDFFLALAEKADSEIKGPDQKTWLSRLELEHSNLLTALRWCDAASDGAAKGLKLASTLWHFWHVHGHFSTGRSSLMTALGRQGVNRMSSEGAKAIAGAGCLAWDQGDYDAARNLLEDSLVIRRELGDLKGVAASLNNLGAVAYQTGNLTEARAKYEESLKIKREFADGRAVANSLNNLGLVAHEQGEYDQAWRLFEESLKIKRELGDKRGIAATLDNQGMVALERGDYDAARTHHEEALSVERDLGDRWGVAASLYNLGTVALTQELYQEAEGLFQDSLTIHRELRDKKGIALAVFGLAVVSCHQEDWESARAFHGQSLIIRKEIGDKGGIACSLEAIAGQLLRNDRPEDAAWLLGAAEALREDIHTPIAASEREQHVQCIRALQESLGESKMARSKEEGRSAPWEEAVEVALRQIRECDLVGQHAEG